jgi:hypothetical protein
MFVDFCEDSHEAEQEKNKKQHRKRNEEMFLSTLMVKRKNFGRFMILLSYSRKMYEAKLFLGSFLSRCVFFFVLAFMHSAQMDTFENYCVTSYRSHKVSFILSRRSPYFVQQ